MTPTDPIAAITPHVRFTSDGPVATLRLDRPAKLNALTLAMHAGIFKALRVFRTAPELKVLILTGTGRAFCAGDDMQESDPRDGAIPPEAETELAWHNLVREMRATPKPIIAAVNGLACGAGGGLMLGSDIRIGSTEGRYADIFIRRGIAGGAYLLTQLVGTGKALELIWTGDFIAADECLRLGIFNRVVAPDALLAESTALARRLADGPAQGIGFSKHAVYQAAHQHLNEGLRTEELAKLVTLRGAEVREGITSFNDKRGAAFAGGTAT
ncbi:MAG: enoyl-CoA hydratase/isomerase family protein [Alphaproteobacteria bacterium]|nr:enoyl-CoA hydratase/isomerase family protein [Alphaproteobacteria bacterium]